MLKIAVVSRYYKERNSGKRMPAHGELWKCRIVKELQSGENRGLFIVEPIEQVSETSIIRLIPGWYDTKLVRGRLIVIPRKPGENWIMPLTHKRIMAEENNAYCVIVQLDGLPLTEAPKDELPPALAVDEDVDVG
tara:strand:+ start:203147 stop:203551 length:405 start_codon:yes stop_codon:yes gene_type:complete